MPQHAGSTESETLPARLDVHVLGAGPVGLLLTALLQSSPRFSVHLYEKRRDYTRTRMVQLASYLVADSVSSYCTDYIDEESISAVFEPHEIDEGLAFRQSIPSDLMTLLRGWTQGFCPLNAIEHALSELIDARRSLPVQRTTATVVAQEAMAMLGPGDILIDCTGARSLLRDHLVPRTAEGASVALAQPAGDDANTFKIRLEYALVVTFLYGRAYDCNEYCKYVKNLENPTYKFIPAVNRTFYDGSITHVTGIVHISAEDFERMPSRFDGQWLRENPSRSASSARCSSRACSARPACHAARCSIATSCTRTSSGYACTCAAR